jgi:integrase
MLAPGDQVPSETELMERYGVSVGTIRKAMIEVRASSLVETRHGKGSYVKARPPLAAPKTRRSERPVPLPTVCVAALREHKERQEAERAAAGEKWKETGLVFTTRHGTPIEPRNLNRYFYPVRERLGLPVRFHDLRHTCVTLLLGLGIPPHIVRDIVGHSALDVTMNIYAHADMGEKRAALDRLGDLLRDE